MEITFSGGPDYPKVEWRRGRENEQAQHGTVTVPCSQLWKPRWEKSWKTRQVEQLPWRYGSQATVAPGTPILEGEPGTLSPGPFTPFS